MFMTIFKVIGHAVLKFSTLSRILEKPDHFTRQKVSHTLVRNISYHCVEFNQNLSTSFSVMRIQENRQRGKLKLIYFNYNVFTILVKLRLRLLYE